MDPREELELLRAKKIRIAELEAKAAGVALPASPAVAQPEESSFLSDLAQGAKSSLDSAALGIKGLLPQAVQDLGDRIDRSLGSGGLTTESTTPKPDFLAGSIGSVGTDIGLALVPGNTILKGAGALKNALRATKYAKAALRSPRISKV